MSGANIPTSSTMCWPARMTRGRRARFIPIFYGSLDWHSCVHGYWMLARLLRRFPDLAQARAIFALLFDEQFVADKVAAECAYLATPTARGFERPYGWAWLLKLAEELAASSRSALVADAGAAGGDLRAEISRLPAARDLSRARRRPSQHGFRPANGGRLRRRRKRRGLAALLRETGARWYGADVDCPAWGEPSGDDFLSSALIEAECMRRLLPAHDFWPWFDRFLPRIAQGEPATLFRPATVTDRTRRQDRPSRRAQPQPRLVLAIARRRPAAARCASGGDGGSGRATSDGGPAACRRRLYGRALAGEFRRARA